MHKSLLTAALAALFLAAPARSQETRTVPPDAAAASEVHLGVLRAQLRPLTVSEVGAELDGWLGLLQAECLEIRDAEVAAMLSEGEAEAAQLNERGVELRAQRSRLIERANAVIASFEEKGGDVAEARAYVDSVVVVPAPTGWKAAYSTAMAWASSKDGGLAMLRSLAIAVGILVAAWLLARALAFVAARMMTQLKHSTALMREFVIKLVSRATLALGLLVALSEFGVDMTPMLAAIGAAGLVLGLALQDTLGNLASGLMILFYRPFDTGDVVQTGGASGRVSGMSLMTTTIKTFDNQVLHVPNSMVWNDVITNKTASKTRRVDMVFGVSYGDDLQKTQSLLERVVGANELVLRDPEPLIKVHELGDSSVNFIVRPWVKTQDYWEVFWALNRDVKMRFDEEGITIPFPQRDVHLFGESAPEASA